MPSEEVFISYSHDSVDHVKWVLDLSNRLRHEGIDCVLDQYETSPPEGWPRWMDTKIRSAKYVLMICTEPYFNRVMGTEKPGTGLGVRWEGNLIYQHLYNAGAINNKFVPVTVDNSGKQFIPTPVQGATFYSFSEPRCYDDLYLRLTDQAKTAKPPLGKRRPLPNKPVKTDPTAFLTSPIDIDLWNQAKWRATFFLTHDLLPPVLGLAFLNEDAARQIFAGWLHRYGVTDKFEELRVSVIEGDIPGQRPGYTVHVGADTDAAIQRFKEAGYAFNEGSLLMTVSRLNRMDVSPNSLNLARFKEAFKKHKFYYLSPGVVSEDFKQLKPLDSLKIQKKKIFLRNSKEIGANDVDSIVLKKRPDEK